MTLYANWRDVDAAEFQKRWPNFSPREIACKGTGRLLVNADALDKLQELRNRLGVPIILTSAYRSPQHNATLPGAAKNSFHMQGNAFDVRMENHNPSHFEQVAREVGFTGIGYYPRSGFMHIDTRPTPATWGTPFPMTDTNLPPEPRERQPETVKEDRELQVVGGAGLLAVASEALKPDASGSSLLDRLTSVEPVTLIVLAAAAYIAWRHMKR